MLEWHVDIEGTFIIVKVIIKGMLDIVDGNIMFFSYKAVYHLDLS